ncbi:hypothetical protein [Mucilaginibacter pankratovii]|uniref:hypothetical protein n=1 Tax=Mucilaginibacter pankratovii TaxID=2772110 RepID=UPI001746081F|nr:hypothetical protein [Mucilaginibacter pankratovii]
MQKDYGINGCLPKGSPPIIPFPFCSVFVPGHLLSFSPFSFGKSFQGKGREKRKEITNFLTLNA